jgi:ABC-type multidrug transport system permease subunit
MNRQNHEQQNLLRRALMGNALFSALSGLIVLIAHGWVSRLLGLQSSVPMLILGISLLGFAAMLVTNARRESLKLSDAWSAVLMDLAWVVGSYALLFVVPFSSGGRWIVALVAELVLGFAVVQWLGIRRIKKAEIYG